MAKMFKYTGLIALMIFSFYYTEKTALFVKSKTPLMQEITKEIDNNNVSSVNAIVSNDYIIPGINGLSVNASKSYVNMKKLGKYNAYYLVFDQVSPKLSVESNKDKIINKGNSKKNGVAIILEKKDNEIAQYFIDNDLKVNKFR